MLFTSFMLTPTDPLQNIDEKKKRGGEGIRGGVRGAAPSTRWKDQSAVTRINFPQYSADGKIRHCSQ